VQGLELVLLAVGVFVAVAYLTVQYVGREDTSRPRAQLALGVIPGLIGVVVVLIAVLDLVPDDLEGGLWFVLFVVVSTGAIVGTGYRWSRR
jgi:hypothetical protein